MGIKIRTKDPKANKQLDRADKQEGRRNSRAGVKAAKKNKKIMKKDIRKTGKADFMDKKYDRTSDMDSARSKNAAKKGNRYGRIMARSKKRSK